MWETVRNGDLEIAAYLARPQEKGPFPAVLVIQEIFGLNRHIRETADRLAEAGYVALAPAIFQRTAPGLDLGYSEAEVALGRSHKDKTTPAQLLSDLSASLAFLEARPEVRPEKFGAIGFCFGGQVAFLAATLPKVSATASFYGAGTVNHLSRAKEIRGEIRFFFGEKDPLIPLAQVDRIETELTAAGTNFSVHRYPTGHGFFCNHRADYDATAAADAWAKTLDLFKRNLG
jgi:carboxymethylenebutenolidase